MSRNGLVSTVWSGAIRSLRNHKGSGFYLRRRPAVKDTYSIHSFHRLIPSLVRSVGPRAPNTRERPRASRTREERPTTYYYHYPYSEVDLELHR